MQTKTCGQLMLKPPPSLAQTQEMLSLTAHFKVLHDLLAGIGREFALHPFPDRFACLSGCGLRRLLAQISDVRQRDTDCSGREVASSYGGPQPVRIPRPKTSDNVRQAQLAPAGAVVFPSERGMTRSVLGTSWPSVSTERLEPSGPAFLTLIGPLSRGPDGRGHHQCSLR
jgi:hypothetical protein